MNTSTYPRTEGPRNRRDRNPCFLETHVEISADEITWCLGFPGENTGRGGDTDEVRPAKILGWAY